MTSDPKWTPGWEGLPPGWTLEDGLESLENALKQEGSQAAIARTGIALISLLLHKNRRYGDSALSPVEIFAKGLTPQQRMGVRMDDKISRLQRGEKGLDNEDAIVDLAGYLQLALALDDPDFTPKN